VCLGIFWKRSVRSRISFCQTFPLGSTLLARANPDCALLYPVKSTDRQTERQHLPARQPSVYGLVPYFLPALEPIASVVSHIYCAQDFPYVLPGYAPGRPEYILLDPWAQSPLCC
jgi:hypothetical protein